MGSAVLFLVLNLIGLGMGPLFVGIVSDLLAPSLGSESLRYALAITAFVGFISAACYLIAARRLPEDLSRVRESKPDSDNTALQVDAV